MKNDAEINDQAYWDRRFREDWQSFGGPDQSRFFALLALKHLPAWLFSAGRQGNFSIADWGCAQGDGTELLAGCFRQGRTTGIDFSATAIQQARDRYPSVMFRAEDWLDEGREASQTFDIVFSSNTLEHFHEPFKVLERVSRHAKKAVVLALPYREMVRQHEHFFTFLPQNIPATLGNGFRLVWSQAADCAPLPNSFWPGEQIFLLYADPGWVAELDLTLDGCRIETEPPGIPVAMFERQKVESAQLQEEIERLQAEQANREAALDAERASHEAALEAEQARQKVGLDEMQAVIAARDADITALRRKLDWSLEEVENLSLALSAGTEHAGRLKRLVEERDAASRLLNERIEAMEGLHTALQGHNDALLGHNMALQGQNAALADHNTELHGQTAALKAELRDARVVTEQSREQQAVLEARIQSAASDLAAQSELLREAEETVRRFAAERQELERQLAIIRSEQASLQQQNLSLQQEGDFQRRELARLSSWASSIAAKPLTYGLKRNAYLAVRTVYRSLPIGPNGKQKLKNVFTRSRAEPVAAPVEGLRLSVAPSVPAVSAPAGGTYVAEPVSSSAHAEATPLPPAAGRRIRPHDGERDVFVFAVIDWHFRIQRPQHLARSLAVAGRRVFFVSNVFVDSATPGYEIEKLDPALGLYQVKLHVQGAPAIYFAPPQPATIQMLQRSLAELIADYGALSSVSLVEHPFWFPLVQTLPNSLRVYDCMDHHEGFGNVPHELVQIEKQMLAESDLVVVTSSWLEDFASGYNEHVAVVRNAVEYDFFCQAPAETFRDPLGRRIIGYFGAIAEWFDIALVRRLATAHPDCLVLLVGNDTVRAAEQLSDLKNVQFTGEVAYRTLPFYLYAFDVCLLPFQVSSLTQATNPVKVYEYLASGKPVVCVDLPEISQFGALVRKASSHEEFAAEVNRALAEEQLPALIGARREFAARQTWTHRSVSLSAALHDLALPRVSVIVLTYNNLDLTQACLESVLRESDYPNLELIVVDNASTDGSPDYLRKFAAANPGVQVILNRDNLGFSAGNNVGLEAATGDYLVILNNDTVVTRGWVLTLLRHLQQDRDIGLVGPITNNIGNGARVETSYTRMEDMPNEAFSITLANMGQTFPLRTAAFFCVMITRQAYERCGPMCEDYGRGFFEDDDYCRRIEQAGLRVVCAEDVFVHHQLSASFSKLPSATRQALFDENRARYEAKWGPWIPHTYAREPRESHSRRSSTEAASPRSRAAAEPAMLAIGNDNDDAEPPPARLASAESEVEHWSLAAREAAEAIARASSAVAARARPFTVGGDPGTNVSDKLEQEPYIHGVCPVCGKQSRFFYDQRVLWRETLNCEHCLCTSRYRSIARGILRAIREMTGIASESLAALPADSRLRRLAVYDTQPPFYWLPCAYPLPDMLKRAGWFDVHLSQYKPDMVAGAQISPGVTNQNLEQLTYASGSLDIVITSDVMEHVRLDERAHREIHRVLRIGGAYVFTVPHDMAMDSTLVRVATPDPNDSARDTMLMEPEYHGDTNGDGGGVLSYRCYGRDLMNSLEALGFEVTYTRAPLPHQGVLQTELFYCRKVRG